MSTTSSVCVHTGCEAVRRQPSSHRGWHQRVVLLRFRGYSLATFGLLAGLGAGAATTLAIARQQQAGMEPHRFALALWIGLPLAVILGARLFALMLVWRELLQAPWQTIKQHGFAFQGGFLAVIASLAGLAAHYDLNLLLLLDTAVLSLPLGHALGRLGCHTYGCCHGRPTRSALAIRYDDPEAKAVWQSGLRGVALFPTQLCAALGNLALFAALSWLATEPLTVGWLSGSYLVAGSAGRFVIERYRGVPVRRAFGLTPFQLVAVPTFLAGIGLLWASAGGSPALLFGGDLATVLAGMGSLAWAPAWGFVCLLIVFGIHGRRLGPRSVESP